MAAPEMPVSFPAMQQMRKNLLVLAVPVLLGGIFLAMGIMRPPAEPAQNWFTPQFEVTVWTDTLTDSALRRVPVVHLSGREAARASMLVLQNQRTLLPVPNLADKTLGLLVLGQPAPVMEACLNRYAPLDTVVWSPSGSEVSASAFANCSHLILVLNQAKESPYQVALLLQRLEKKMPVIVVCFDPYQLLSQISGHHSLLLAPNHAHASQEAAAQVVFGGLAATRGLPSDLARELGLVRSWFTAKNRLGYADPEFVGLSSDTLALIDQIIREAMAAYAFPGAQVLVARQGEVIYHKAFGYHTYEQQRPVRLDDLYDLASITKVAGTTLAAMHMVETGKLALDAEVGEYLRNARYRPGRRWITDTIPLSEWKRKLGADSSLADVDARPWRDSLVILPRRRAERPARMYSPVFDVSIQQLLTHTSGLQASLDVLPYQRLQNSTMYDATFSNRYSVPVAQHFFLDRFYLDSLWNDVKALDPDTAGYRYSCVNMILLQRVIDSLNRQPLDQFLDQHFYRLLGLQTLGFNPLARFDARRMVPTASDPWRGQLLCGTVHDPTAALFGGVSGNAGLFSNAHDLGILGQLWLNGGEYGGQRLLQAKTVELFTQRTSGHRGLGFDMPPRMAPYLVAESASLSTFGHTGFTGTCIWVDPEHDLVFVFLSNRIHPSIANNRINDLRVRQQVHQVVYRAMGVPPDPNRIPGIRDVAEPENSPALAVEGLYLP